MRSMRRAKTFVMGLVGQPAEHFHAGIVERAIKAPKLVDCRIDHSFYLLFIANVDLEANGGCAFCSDI